MIGALRRARDSVSIPWLVATCAMVAFIWGNSMIPGEGSSQISLSVLSLIRDWLDGLGFPSSWLTHHLVRKLGHVTEYAALAVLATLAWSPKGRPRRGGVATSLVMCVLVASVDETIQLVTPDRMGQVLDVLIDSVGIAIGSAFALAALCLARRFSDAHGCGGADAAGGESAA